MIRDYKFDPAFDDRRRRKGFVRFVFFGFLVLGTAAAAWQFLLPELDISSESPSEVALPLPQAPAKPSEPEPELVSQQLSLPNPANAQDTSAGPMMPAVEQKPTSATYSASPANEDAGPAKSLLAVAAPQQEKEHSALTLPVAAAAAPTQAENPAPQMGPQWLSHTVSSGESLAKIFKSKELSPSLLHRLVNSSDTAKQLARIRPGQELRFLLTDENELEELVLVKSPVEKLHIRAKDDSFVAEMVSKDVERRVASATGTIQSSLFMDGQKAGLSDSQIMELAALFGWDIDFALEIRAGDQFRLLYEEQFLDGEKYKDGPILAAEFVNQGKIYSAYRFDDGDGNVGYYNEKGLNKRRAFIRTPIKFARVSSRFAPKRWHPVLKKWRSHKGVDYAAPTGTPIKATGAGKVIFRGWKGGYGRVVIVQHGSKYRTLYAHMSKFSSKAKAGSKVKQGQIVGYVGKSGLATGPHLHYEFRVNGVHRNPLTVKLPKSLPLPKNKLAAFKKQTAPLVAQLASVAQSTMVATNEH